MLIIFTIPKPFIGHNKIIQINAIKSWRKIVPACEIILFGDDSGVAEAATSLGVKHEPDIAKNDYGTPLLGDAFNRLQAKFPNAVIMYSNSDLIYFQDLMLGVEVVSSNCLLSGRRWDMDITHELDYSVETWESLLRERIKSEGKLHGYAGMDYFIFKSGTITLPPFAVGRQGWDSWLVYDVKERGIPVIDATQVVTAIHQNHDYSHSKFSEKVRVGGPEVSKNIELAGGRGNMATLRDADYILTREGLKPQSLAFRSLSAFSRSPLGRVLLSIKRRF